MPGTVGSMGILGFRHFVRQYMEDCERILCRGITIRSGMGCSLC